MSQPDPAYASMQDWMQQWADLETRLSVLLLKPQASPDFAGHLQALQAELHDLMRIDADSALYWLFQLAASSTVGYSTSHSMTCAALCELTGVELGLSEAQRHSLGLAALSMNVAMTQLQDQLALQTTPPSEAQREAVDTHAARGAQWLRELGVRDPLWLQTVEQHHDATSTEVPTRVLMAADRYAALISPRESRPGRCVTDSGRHVAVQSAGRLDEVGHAFLRSVGICPPGTFVRLADGRVAVVLRRSQRPGEPWVASVLDAEGHPIAEPELVDTGHEGCGIEAALVSATVRVRLNHTRLLQLSRMALVQP
jgi:HD-GYP domain-containing protein (c-di-GMP phosphodiesterase class II)